MCKLPEALPSAICSYFIAHLIIYCLLIHIAIELICLSFNFFLFLVGEGPSWITVFGRKYICVCV